MLEELSRVLGLDGFAVRAVRERGDELDLEVELVATVAVCPVCGRPSAEIKERPLVRVLRELVAPWPQLKAPASDGDPASRPRLPGLGRRRQTPLARAAAHVRAAGAAHRLSTRPGAALDWAEMLTRPLIAGSERRVYRRVRRVLP